MAMEWVNNKQRRVPTRTLRRLVKVKDVKRPIVPVDKQRAMSFMERLKAAFMKKKGGQNGK